MVTAARRSPLAVSNRAALPAPTWPLPRRARACRTALTPGPLPATGARSNRFRRATSRAKSSATSNSTAMATGARTQATAPSGCRAPCRPTGRPTEPAIGAGFPLGAGHGLTMRPGGLRPSTMAAGRRSDRAGPGCQVAPNHGPCMHLHW